MNTPDPLNESAENINTNDNQLSQQLFTTLLKLRQTTRKR